MQMRGVGSWKRVADVISPIRIERNKHGDRVEWSGVYANFIRVFLCFCGQASPGGAGGDKTRPPDTWHEAGEERNAGRDHRKRGYSGDRGQRHPLQVLRAPLALKQLCSHQVYGTLLQR